jgi:hypothetical protein
MSNCFAFFGVFVQAANAAPFRAVNRYVGNLPPNARRIS